MSAFAILAAATSASMTFICTPTDVERASLPYVVSFERKDDRLRHIWIIWPNGSQSRDNWKGEVSDDGFTFSRRGRGMSSHWLRLRLDASRPGWAHLSTTFVIPLLIDTDEAECAVRTVSDQRESA